MIQKPCAQLSNSIKESSHYLAYRIVISNKKDINEAHEFLILLNKEDKSNDI